ncbi:MAG: PEP-utilizing enzyme [Patescibacteria group bacterium]
MEPPVNLNSVYVAGRVGELATVANPLTFSLLKLIFDSGGPYNNILLNFGLGTTKEYPSYLKNIYGQVYSDIELENKAIWEASGYRLVVSNNNSVLKFHVKGNLIKSIKGFLNKTFIEVKILNNIEEYIEEASSQYKDFSDTVESKFKSRELSINDFLDLYESVVYVSYLYELVFSYNNHKKIVPKDAEIQEYVNTNDYLLNDKVRFLEHEVSSDFYLGEERRYLGQQLNANLIPSTLPDLTLNIAKTVKAEVLFQCYKNNMRLKTGLMLSLLNDSLREFADKNNVKYFGFLTLDELGKLNKLPSANHLAVFRKKEYRPYLNLPTVLTELPDIPEQSLQAVEPFSFVGIPCSPGFVKGTLQVVNSVKDTVKGDILVFPNASPTFTEQFKKAKGLVFKVGSPLSHGSIVAREMGIPAIVLDKSIQNFSGDNVVLNGKTGELRAL